MFGYLYNRVRNCPACTVLLSSAGQSVLMKNSMTVLHFSPINACQIGRNDVSLQPKRYQCDTKTNKIMAQSAMTVRLDSQMKSRFDELCVKFGMSANTAINVFVNAVVRTQSIPFSIATNETPGDAVSPEVHVNSTSAGEKMLAWYQHHLESLDPNEPEMTLDEINEEIRLARAERKAKLEK